MNNSVVALALVSLFVLAGVSPAQAQARFVVSPQGPYTTIEAALADARSGDTIEVRGGVYAAPLVVNKGVKLIGVDWPLIQGPGKGTVVKLEAEGIGFQGFEVRGSGVEPDLDDSGIIVSAPRIVIEGNRLRDVLFGVFISKAEEAVVRGNDISGKAEYDSGRKGDSIRIWYSPRVLVERNHVHETRDVVLWYAEEIVVRDNLIERGRYGVHLMYANNAVIERNRIYDNSVGIFAMYSKHIAMRHNLVRGQRGPSGYALGFKDVDNIVVSDNVVVDNRVGVYMDGTPFNPQATSRVQDNIIAFNDVGAVLLPAVKGNVFESNTFWENVEQVAVQGGGLLAPNRWQGNYWSDYTGYDVNDDGRGEAPYRSERFFDSMMDREPVLRALLYSPAVQALEVAATTFPIVRPQPKLVDERPRFEPAAVPPQAVTKGGNPAAMSAVGALLLGLGIMCGVLALPRRNHEEVSGRTSEGQAKVSIGKQIQVSAKGVGKQFGKVRVLNDVSFEVGSAQALALWGANGAGKTTLIKAILGLIDFEGTIRIDGQDVKRAGKIVRRSIGYVPQETVFNDWSVRHTLEFFARLKGVRSDERGARIGALMGRMGLREHANKAVTALSGGLKQRLALAIALLADPPLLLLDEPTANLDKQARTDYLSLLADLRQEGKTIIFTSHRFEEVENLADEVLVLEHGVLAELLTPEEMRAKWMREIELTLWVSDEQRAQALACLKKAGLEARLNGRGTVVCRVRIEQKMRPLQTLSQQGIEVFNFEIERGRTWN